MKPTSWNGVPGGTGAAPIEVMAGGSGLVSWKVIVRCASSTTIPRERSQWWTVHLSAPTMLVKRWLQPAWTRKSRSIARRKSSGCTSRPLE